MKNQTKHERAGTDPVDESADRRSVLDLIKDIRTESLNARLLASSDRQSCVAHLTGEGLSVAEIAKIL